MNLVVIGNESQNHMFLKGDSGSLSVELVGESLRASITVYLVQTTHSYLPASFFKELADNWKGWDGEINWHSLEGEFLLSAKHNTLGTIEITAEVIVNSYQPNLSWMAGISISVDAGEELARLTNQVESLFS